LFTIGRYRSAIMKAKQAEKEQRIELPPMQIQNIHLRLIGDSSLICHAWSDKAKKEMLDKQMKRAKQAKEAKDPEQLFRDSLYPLPDGGYGFPAVAFKASAVNACSHVGDMTKVVARGAFHIDEEMVKIESDDPTMREDMVRIGMGVADIRYRGEFKTWSVTLKIRLNSSVISAEQIANLFDIAGFAIGVGEWRPQKSGSYGMFHVARKGE
jgi:hypothetical protein